MSGHLRDESLRELTHDLDADRITRLDEKMASIEAYSASTPPQELIVDGPARPGSRSAEISEPARAVATSPEPPSTSGLAPQSTKDRLEELAPDQGTEPTSGPSRSLPESPPDLDADRVTRLDEKMASIEAYAAPMQPQELIVDGPTRPGSQTAETSVQLSAAATPEQWPAPTSDATPVSNKDRLKELAPTELSSNEEEYKAYWETYKARHEEISERNSPAEARYLMAREVAGQEAPTFKEPQLKTQGQAADEQTASMLRVLEKMKSIEEFEKSNPAPSPAHESELVR